ncbi:hypothetical protein J8F10_20780 [Gemmata sp. G18]|uniref:3-keto-disaccharide hydrolase domain-containing protein n=1 Tax=Gemmata palustris TaxID=2822762 RepID=A0ABS5BVE7_9BACT|nr:hypothetical protein [Gemmata palustris]MBP3957693.1 hypothetical protein [Gemmata palustris]
MPTSTTFGVAALVFLIGSSRGSAEEVIFEDNFKNGLSKKWEPIGLDKEDYRIKDGGLEMRVRNGGLGKDTPNEPHGRHRYDWQGGSEPSGLPNKFGSPHSEGRQRATATSSPTRSV